MYEQLSPIRISCDEWRARVDATFKGGTYRERYYAYIDTLSSRGLPVLFGLASIAEVLQLKRSYVAAMVNATDRFYRTFCIPKKSGGQRQIDMPAPALLYAQRWILSEILAVSEPEESATGFRSGIGLLANAIPHIGQLDLLKMDLKDFFGSIGIRRVIAVFRQFGYSERVSFALARLSCLRQSLPQGAATSPHLSNLIARRLDQRLSGLANKAGLSFTRYADDLTFSGDRITFHLSRLVEKIAADESFSINPQKTTLVQGKRKKVVTGISVATDRPRLPRALKRKWRAEIHSLVVRGYEQHCALHGIRDPLYLDRVVGRLNFWAQVEPDNNFVSWATSGLHGSEVVS